MNDIDHEQDEQIIRYLREQLSTEDKARFEVRMLEEPELLERVQLLEALQLQLRAEEAALMAADDAAPVAAILPFRGWLRQPLSLAASLLIAVLGLNALLDTPREDPTALPVGALVLLDARRDAAVPVFSGSGPYLLQVDAGFGNEADAMQLTLRDAEGAVLLQRDMSVDQDGWVRLLYTQALGGEYRVELQWTDSAGASQALAYPFIVQNP